MVSCKKKKTYKGFSWDIKVQNLLFGYPLHHSCISYWKLFPQSLLYFEMMSWILWEKFKLVFFLTKGFVFPWNKRRENWIIWLFLVQMLDYFRQNRELKLWTYWKGDGGDIVIIIIYNGRCLIWRYQHNSHMRLFVSQWNSVKRTNFFF